MQMRLLWSLPKAVPALLRHFVGYLELAADDIERLESDFRARLLAGAVVGVCLFFLILSGVLVLVAMTWDTPHRVAAILWMGCAFLLLAVVAWLYRSNVISAQQPTLAAVRKEWAEDKIILEHILAPDKD